MLWYWENMRTRAEWGGGVVEGGPQQTGQLKVQSHENRGSLRNNWELNQGLGVLFAFYRSGAGSQQFSKLENLFKRKKAMAKSDRVAWV